MTETSTAAVAPRHVSANVFGSMATAVVIVLCLVLIGTWTLGTEGDLLLSAAALGLLFRIPYTVAVWAGLTVLGTAGFALALNGAALAESLANLAYYALAVGCLWALWNAIAEQFHWEMPATMLHGYLARANAYRYVPHPIAAVALVFVAAAIAATNATGLTGGVIAGLVILGVLWRSSLTLVVAACATLTGVAILHVLADVYAGSYRVSAETTGLLAIVVVFIALLRIGMRVVVTRLKQPTADHVRVAEQERARDGSVPPAAPANDRNAVNV